MCWRQTSDSDWRKQDCPGQIIDARTRRRPSTVHHCTKLNALRAGLFVGLGVVEPPTIVQQTILAGAAVRSTENDNLCARSANPPMDTIGNSQPEPAENEMTDARGGKHRSQLT